MAFPEGLVGYALVALCSVLAPALFGFGLVRWLGVSRAHGLRLAWGLGYLVGHYVLSQVTLLWLIGHQPFPGVLLPITAAVVGVLLLRRSHRRDDSAVAPASTPRQPTRWFVWLPVVLLSCALVHAFLTTNIAPVRFSDEAVNWAAKAKVLYTAKGFELGRGLGFFVDHPDYPLFNPLTQVLAFASSGRVLHFENRLPVQFFAIALLLMLSAGTTRRAHPLVAGLALVAFAGTSFMWLATTAYADIMLACATLAAAESLLRWRETGERVFFALACLAFGAMISTKNEGLVLVATVMAPFVLDAILARMRTGEWAAVAGLRWRSVLWMLVPAMAVVLHRGMNSWFSVQNELTNPALAQGHGLIARIVSQLSSHGEPVLAYYGRMLVDPVPHRLLPLLFLVAAPLAWLMRGRVWLAGAGPLMLLTFVGATSGYMLVFTGTIFDVNWHLQVAADRIMQHVLPLAVLGLTASAWPRVLER